MTTPRTATPQIPLISPPDKLKATAHIKDSEHYDKLYRQSIEHTEQFWDQQATANLTWMKKWRTVLWHDFSSLGKSPTPYVKFFDGGQLNVSVNCLDRHVAAGRGNNTAIIWHSDDGSKRQTITFAQLLAATCRLANVLKKHGVKKGNVVTIYLPLIPEAAIAMLACSRIGAIHSVVFSAFSAQALHDRIRDGQSKIVITTDVSYHAGKTISLKGNVDAAVKGCPSVKKIITLRRGLDSVAMKKGRDFWWHEEISKPDNRISPITARQPSRSQRIRFLFCTLAAALVSPKVSCTPPPVTFFTAT